MAEWHRWDWQSRPPQHHHHHHSKINHDPSSDRVPPPASRARPKAAAGIAKTPGHQRTPGASTPSSSFSRSNATPPWTSLTRPDLAILSEIISLAVPSEPATPSRSLSASTNSENKSTDLFRILRALSSVFPASEKASVAQRDKYRQLLLRMDNEFPKSTWWEKLNNLRRLVDGGSQSPAPAAPGSQSMAEDVARRYILEPSTYLNASQPVISSYCARHQFVLSQDRAAHPPPRRRSARSHVVHKHNGSSVLLNDDERIDDHSSIPVIRPELPVEMSSILHDFTERDTGLPGHMDDTRQPDTTLRDMTTLVYEDAKERSRENEEGEKRAHEAYRKEERARRVMVARNFYAWLGYVRSIKSRKARLVTHWMLAVKHWQVQTLKSTMALWIARMHQIQVRQAAKRRRLASAALHAMRRNVGETREAAQIFRLKHIARSAFLTWRKRAAAIVGKRSEIALAQNEVSQRYARRLVLNAMLKWRAACKDCSALRKSEREVEAAAMHNLTRQIFHAWRYGFLHARALHTAVAYHRVAMQKMLFAAWQVASQQRAHIRAGCDLLASVRSAGNMKNAFIVWRNRTTELRADRAKLDLSEKFHRKVALQKGITIWKWWNSLQNRHHIVARRQAAVVICGLSKTWIAKRHRRRLDRRAADQALLKRMLTQWRQYTARNKTYLANYAAFKKRRARTQQAAFLSKWRQATSRKQELDRICTAMQVRLQPRFKVAAWHQWRQRLAIRLAQKKKEQEAAAHYGRVVERQFIREWQQRYREHSLRQRRNRIILRELFAQWRAQFAYVTVYLRASSKCQLAGSPLQHLPKCIWSCNRGASLFQLRLYNVFVQHQVRNSLRRWRQLYREIRWQHTFVAQSRVDQTTRKLFSHWKHRADYQIEMRQNALVENFRTLMTQRLQRECLQALRFNYRQRILCRQVSLAKREQLCEVIKAQVFREWLRKYRVLTMRSMIATERHNRLYISQVWWVWILRTHTKQRQNMAYMALSRWYDQLRMRSIFEAWHASTESTRDLRQRQRRIMQKSRTTKMEIILSSWRMALRCRLLKKKELALTSKRNKEVQVEFFMHWRCVYLELRAHRRERSILLRKFTHLWIAQWREKIHNELSTRLHKQRRAGMIFRQWLWRTWESIAPDCIKFLQLTGQATVASFLNDPSLRAQYVTKSVPEDLDMFQRLDRVGRILSTTEVQTIIYAEPSDSPPEGYSHRAKWRASVMLVHQLTKNRREAYVQADAVYRPRVLKRSFIYWLQHQRSTRAFKAQAMKMAITRERDQIAAAFARWRAVLDRLDDRKENARIAYRYNLTNNAVRFWRLTMEARAEDERKAGAAHQIARLMQAWSVWRKAVSGKRLAVKKKVDKQLADQHRQWALLRSAFRTMREVYVSQRDLRNATIDFRAKHLLRECFHKWLYGASQRILLAEADATAVQHANSNIQKRAMAVWVRRLRLAIAGQSLANLMAARMVTRFFLYWKLRGHRKLQIARKMVALRRLQAVMLESRCRKIFQAWHGFVERRNDLELAQARFTHRLYAIHGVMAPPVARDEIASGRSLARLKTAFALWRAKRVDRVATRAAERSVYQRRWGQWVRWVAERKAARGTSAAFALGALQSGTKRRVLSLWMRRLQSRHEQRALLTQRFVQTRRKNVLPRLFGHWLARTRAVREMEEMAVCTRRVDVALSAFVRWKIAAAARARNRVEERKRNRWLELADKRYRHRTLRSAMTLWLRRLQRTRRSTIKSVTVPPPPPPPVAASVPIAPISESRAVAARDQAAVMVLHSQARNFRGRKLILAAWNVWRTMTKLRAFEGCRKMIFAATWQQRMLQRRVLLAWAGDRITRRRGGALLTDSLTRGGPRINGQHAGIDLTIAPPPSAPHAHATERFHATGPDRELAERMFELSFE
ncbi:hypothetical protein HDU88_003455 [Geranomyces variabilis]|nr:hypothetical protein HDU88_003455 [Geranomyces variabilis]